MAMKRGRRRVRFELVGEGGSEVYVAGTFNGWDPTKNRMKVKAGVYETSILLAPGRYEYKFVVDGVWCVDPRCSDWVPNEMGSLNSVLVVT